LVGRFFHARRRALYLKALQHGVFFVAPVVLTSAILFSAARSHSLGLDFNLSFWPAAHEILNGGSPYVSPGAHVVLAGEAFVFPAVGALLLAPFGLLPRGLATWIFVAICLVSVLSTLRILRVRDWRLYGLSMLWWPVVSGWQVANISLPLVVGVALMWRYRDRAVVAGALLALLISAKLFLWPLGVWLLATRRYASLAYAAVFGLILNVAAWAVIGFSQLSRYERLSVAFVNISERRGAGLVAWAVSHGISSSGAHTLMLAVATVAAAACFVLGRRGDDRMAMAMGVLTALLATPIIWIHYYALLIVPLAVARPRFTSGWAVATVLLIAFAPRGGPTPLGTDTLQLGLLACVLVSVIAAVRDPALGDARLAASTP
jgi:glycosyl transferase family 87